MGYIANNLINNETIIYKANVHWAIYIFPLVALAIGIASIAAGASHSNGAVVIAGFFVSAIGVWKLIAAWIFKFSTELAVTSRRVIAKFGFIRRNTIELNHDKVESLGVDQGILGRMLKYGTIFVHGTGGGETPIPNIDDPLDFRKRAMETIDSNKNNLKE